LRSESKQALAAYTALHASVGALRAAFPPDALAHLDLLLDALQEELLSQSRPASMDEVKALPSWLHAPAIIALIDRAGTAARDAALLDWYRFQIARRPDLVRCLLSAGTVRTPAGVLRWLDKHAAAADEDSPR
jgi:hypothetical protein